MDTHFYWHALFSLNITCVVYSYKSMWRRKSKKEGESRRAKYKQLVKECRFHILLLLMVFVLYLTQATIQQKFMPTFPYYYDGTAVIETIDSDFVHIFQKEIFSSITYLMTFVYIAIYPGTIIYTFLILGHYKEVLLFKRFSLMFSLNYLIAFPFFMFFNVSTTGATLQSVQPLMYTHFPHIFSAVSAIDPLDNCFPSLHVAMIFSAFLIILDTNFKRYKIFLYFAFPTTAFSVFYLGIHWIIDVFAGLALAFITYYVTKSFYE